MANQMFLGQRLFNSGKIDISSGNAVALAGTMGVGFNTNLFFIAVINTSANPTVVTITDGINTIAIGAPANCAGSPATLPVPFQSAANTSITAQATSGQTSVFVSAQGTITG